MTDPILIVGAGQAGIKAAEALRAKGCAEPIIMVGEEPSYPYQRPPLSKAFLMGKIDKERLYLKTPKWMDDVDVELKQGSRATALDPAGKKLHLKDGQALAYSKLLITTGTKARKLPLPGAQLGGVHTLRSIADSQNIASDLEGAEHIVIIGGGFIGMEVAAAARSMGKTVSVIEAQDRVLKRSVAPAMSHYLDQLHKAHGVTIITSMGVVSLEGDGHVGAVRLADGSRLDCDLVLISAGAEPEVALAQSAQLGIERGIIVDQACRTTAQNVFAAGDCTIFPSGRYGRLVGLESVQNACDQAKVAAAAMLGEDVSYDPVPWFWSDQFDVKLQIAGLSAGFDRTEMVGSPSDGRFSIRYFSGSRLLAVDSINDARGHMMARRDIAALEPAIAA